MIQVMASTPNTFYNNNHFLDRGSKGIAGSFKEYEYDKNGNLIADYNKQIDIAYNPLNLPQSVVWANGQRIDWVYSASGEKLQKIVKDSLGAVVYTKSYLGNYEYVDSSLEAIYFSEGRATPGQGGAFAFEYAITDHLGNGRVWWRWDEEDLRPEVLQAADYYPFGLEQAQPGTVQIGVVNPYKFNGSVTGDTESKKVAGLGMEEVTDHGLNIYNAFYRTYVPVIGRMMQIDPMAEDPGLISMTPYNAFLNNPVLYPDPNGDVTGWTPSVGFTKHNLQRAAGFVTGLYQTAKATVVGAVDAVIHPKRTVESTVSAIAHPKQTADAIKEGVNEWAGSFDDPNKSTSFETGRMQGQIAGAIWEAVFGTKALGKLGKADEVSDVGSTSAKISSEYKDVTIGNSTPNVKTDVSKGEFGTNLEKSGYNKTTSKDGKATIYTKGDSRYSMRDNAKSTGGPTVDFSKSGKGTDLKIRLPKPAEQP